MPRGGVRGVRPWQPIAHAELYGTPAQAHIANYTGHAKVDRLIFIAEKTAGGPLELEALKLAHDELKRVRAGDQIAQIRPLHLLRCTLPPWGAAWGPHAVDLSGVATVCTACMRAHDTGSPSHGARARGRAAAVQGARAGGGHA
jgi:hypothetical protein